MAKKSFTPLQKEALVEFMENHPDLRKGKFSINFTTATAKKLWVKYQIMLNSIPGPAKEWNEWRKDSTTIHHSTTQPFRIVESGSIIESGRIRMAFKNTVLSK
ncbi:hypothetical protein ACI65C_008774 [Semiaphis heraclei]